MPLLDIQNLTVEFATRTGPFRAVDGISLSVEAGEVLAIVGESGFGQIGVDAGGDGAAALDRESGGGQDAVRREKYS